MDKISFAVYGPPQGKARPRVVRMKNGRTMSYTPDKTVAYEELVRKKYLETAGRPLLWEGPVSVQIIAEYPIPKSVSRKKAALMLNGDMRPTKKPDWDNIGKIICDSLNGIAYKDDAQIIRAIVIKRYSDFPQVCVTIGRTE